MYFETMLQELRTSLRDRVRNGDLTERSLARSVGVSQPHMHNVLKGIRTLSPAIADRVLGTLKLTALDLVHRDALVQHMELGQPGVRGFSFVRCLAGKMGPGHPWPKEIGSLERIPFSAKTLENMGYPVLVRTGQDLSMAPIFGADDLVLLDQLTAVRTTIDPKSYYLIRMADHGIIRRLRHVGNSLYIVSQTTLARPDAWEKLELDNVPIEQVVRARAIFIPKENEWIPNVYPLLPGKAAAPVPPSDAN
jgi:hypothetical protein